jgi:outer membrane protein OmpA-like peptidoglycan-associated protein
MLKRALLATILVTASFTFASAEPPLESKERAGPARDAGSGGKGDREAQTERGQTPPEADADGKESEQEGTVEQDSGPDAKSKAAKKQNRDDRAKGEDTKPKDADRASGKGEAEKTQPVDRAAGEAKQQEPDRAKSEVAKGAEERAVPSRAADPEAPSVKEEANTEAEKKKQIRETDRARSGADNADKAKQPAEAAEGAKQEQEADRGKADRARSESAKESTDPGRGEGDANKRQDAERATDGEKSAGENGSSARQPTREADRAPPTTAAGKKHAMMPADEQKAKEAIVEERANADKEFQKAKESAKATAGSGKEAPRIDNDAAANFEKVRDQRRERVEQGVALIEEPGKRVIVRDKDRAFIRHDEGERLGRSSREQRRERRPDGTTIVVNLGFGGFEITSVFNDNGQLLRRSRQDRGREVVLIDNTDFYRRHKGQRYVDAYVDLPPLVIGIPREKYILEYDRASDADVYDALIAPPLERLERGYSLEEVRQSYPLRERMRRVDLDAVNFAFASWEIDPEQYPTLERIAKAMKRIIERNPDEMFMVEGHTDAVGSDIDNLSLSDRRAESVAIVLSDTFRVPPENLTTQGYGEEFLKVDTEGPSGENRRVAVRRITPLLSHNQRQSLD